MALNSEQCLLITIEVQTELAKSVFMVKSVPKAPSMGVLAGIQETIRIYSGDQVHSLDLFQACPKWHTETCDLNVAPSAQALSFPDATFLLSG